MRCLKRYIAREIHRVLTRPPQPAPRGQQLAALRREHGIKQKDLAARLGVHDISISQVENGKRHRPDFQRRMLAELTAMTT